MNVNEARLRKKFTEILFSLKKNKGDGNFLIEIEEIRKTIQEAARLNNNNIDNIVREFKELFSISFENISKEFDSYKGMSLSTTEAYQHKELVENLPVGDLLIDAEFKTEAVERLRVKPWEIYVPQNHKPGKKLTGGRRLEAGYIRPSFSNTPLVSVITVCWNSGEYLLKAINSVAKQSYKNVEHIIVDGGSTDDTLDILDKSKNIVDFYISEPDSGIYDAMNKAINYTDGDYIVILNSDDSLDEKFIEVSLSEIIKSRADITYCNYRNESGEVSCPQINEAILFSQLNIKHNTFFLSKETFLEVGYFDATRKINSDARWIRLALLKDKKFKKIDKTLVFYSSRGLSSAESDKTKKS